ncbi:DUF927 domain-containing protein [Pseudomonas sp.]|uniref:DUF927 domain-containing protein n=1 Tax=Pseudomonas sp. TaxID=306 RepID=UPI00260B2C79|nr:DUF927 domain-containing protein [Pseudomonas sp.]
MAGKKIDFQKLNLKLIELFDDLMTGLGLNGELRGNEFVAFNPKRNDSELGSFSINATTGVWADFAEDDNAKGGDLISLVAYLKDVPQVKAANMLIASMKRPDEQRAQPLTTPTASASPSTSNTANRRPQRRQNTDPGTLLYPAPAGAPDPIQSYHGLGYPSMSFPYRNEMGDLLGYILRFDLDDGKTIRPALLMRSPAGRVSWRFHGFPTPHPLYNLDQIATNREAHVLLVEGEKTANAARALFPDHVVTTTMHGAKSAGKADLTPLAGREVMIWPDHDKAGQDYAEQVANILVQGDHPARVKIMQPFTCEPGIDSVTGSLCLTPGFVPPTGWDAADAVAMGWTAEHISLLPDCTFEPMHTPGPVIRYGKFLIRDDGVFIERKDKEGPYLTPLSSRIDVEALTRNKNGQQWGLLLKFKDRDGNVHEWSMPREMLSGRVEDYRRQLLSLGADLAPKGGADFLTEFLIAATPQARALCVDSTGWHGNVFVLPKRVFGQDAEPVLFQTTDAVRHPPFGTSGTLDQWKIHVGAKCVGNSRMVTAVCIAMAGPLLDLLGEENGGFHFRGASSSGKTKTLSVAASIWGDKGMVRIWRTTSNAIESLAMEHNECVLILDELGQVSPQDAGDIAYTLANGQAKARANRMGGVRPIASWRLLFISTGEIGLAEHVAAGGGRIRAGQEIRMLDIPSDGGCNLGVFENLHGAASPQAFADQLQQLSEAYYGTVAEALLTTLTSNAQERDRAVSMVQAIQGQFVGDFVPVDSHGQVFRAASRFGMVAGVGEYAISIGALPWDAGEALHSVQRCFHSWLGERGGNVASEELRALAQVRHFLEQYGESRFTLIAQEGLGDNNIGDRTNRRVGFRKVLDDGTTEYLVLSEAYKNDLCEGFDYKLVTRVLNEHGFLQRGSDGKSTVVKRLPGVSGSIRVYVINPSIFISREAAIEIG